MKAEIITIGDEILIGQIVDTNSAWIGQQLNLIGIKVAQITSVSDEKEHILQSLKSAEQRADIILITGGLGPTKDDITKHTLCEYFNTKLRTDEEVLNMVTEFFAKRNRALTELNRKQAEVPLNCRVIKNYEGTAPAMWFEERNKIIISIPGVPYEMMAIMSGQIIPLLKEKLVLPAIYHYSVLTQGIGESFLAEKIEDWENNLALHNIKLAYLPSTGMLRLRLSTSGKNKEELKNAVQQEVSKLQQLIPKYIYGYEEYGEKTVSLQEIVGELLLEKKQQLAIAESCTGGYIAHLITSVPGSSAYFSGSILPYHNQFKHSLLGVNNEIFTTVGAVSEACVLAMAKGVKQQFNADYAIATSGIAGPGGGTAEKPVGTVWIAIAGPQGTIAEKFIFGNNRERNIIITATTALNMLRKVLMAESEE